MLTRALRHGLVSALLGATLALATLSAQTAEPQATTATQSADATTPEGQPQSLGRAAGTQLKINQEAEAAAACTKRCADASGNLKSCKIVNSIPMYTCTSPNNICSGACF
ncbi:hypothetical protein SAMN02949497_0859 [Methylomagnum ishizawai]|uniref:Uncharacterized protein n=1 Tax=Methylomagnum ishizawai TaxID=1760988 RepID=A0A1Y6CZ38_9GAMM|nr:hypothetical protein [Methylomagnum ishizawai]SMF93572.1 hypothetical protein SAMN02949497_0859 [Methylomagnum ishizawai]